MSASIYKKVSNCTTPFFEFITLNFIISDHLIIVRCPRVIYIDTLYFSIQYCLEVVFLTRLNMYLAFVIKFYHTLYKGVRLFLDRITEIWIYKLQYYEFTASKRSTPSIKVLSLAFTTEPIRRRMVSSHLVGALPLHLVPNVLPIKIPLS